MDRNRSVAVWALLPEFEFLNGLFAAYMLTAASLAPLYGRLSDLVGRKPLLLGCIAIFLVGSALCGGNLKGIHFDLDSSMAEYAFSIIFFFGQRLRASPCLQFAEASKVSGEVESSSFVRLRYQILCRLLNAPSIWGLSAASGELAASWDL